MLRLNKSKTLATATMTLVAALGFATSASAIDDRAWNKYTEAGAKAYEANNFGQAEKMFQLALKEAEKFGPNDIRLATSLTNVGVIQNFRGNQAKAEPLFEHAIKIKQKVLGPDNPDVVSAVCKLCQFYIGRGNYAKADNLAQKIITFGNRKVHELNQVQASFKTLIDFYQEHPEFEGAERLMKQAESLTEKESANQNLELAVLLDRLATSYKEASDASGNKSRLVHAEQLYKNALELRQRTLVAEHGAVAQSLENLAKLYVAQDKHTLAEPLFRKALAISEKSGGLSRPDAYPRLDGMAQCCVATGRLQEAEGLYRKAVENLEAAYGKHSKYVATALLGLGSVLSREGRYGEAVPMVARAVKIYEAVNGPQHASMSPLLDNYADLLDRTNRKSEAAKLHARARAIRG